MIFPERSAWRTFFPCYRVLVTRIVPPNKSDLKKHFQHQDQRGSLTLLLGNLLGTGVLHPFGKNGGIIAFPTILVQFYPSKAAQFFS